MLWQQMLFDAAALCWKSSGCYKDFKFMCQEEQEGTMANGYQTNILTTSYRGIQVCSFCNLVDVGKHRHTNCVGINFCVATTGAFGKNVVTFGCRGNMSPTFSAKPYLRRLPPTFSGGMRTEWQQLRCMVQVSNAIDNMGRASNIDCNSNRDCK